MVVMNSIDEGVLTMQNYIRVANNEDKALIKAYFRQAYNHYEMSGELLAMQDIKYFLEKVDIMRFYVTEESTLQITYVFEIPGGNVGDEPEFGQVSIPYQNN